ncbi:FkbM family methyltransferase [Pontibacter locisalis]|uniref:FkbM family methyltransferase n=1 Tax=Pontibacter locisalis TaxID=1719035 RepID=A0ABW5IRC2_9BACT
MFAIPILFIVFNRPDTTRKVFAQIRSIKPSRLYIAADGPRAGREGDFDLCSVTRDIVLGNVDWECEVKTLLREDNLGCGVAPSSAITWFFENEEAGIILEDDCLPSLSFFRFAEYCLQKYKNNPKIMHIGGNNFLGRGWGSNSYFYSAYNHVWGWATWRRAWNLYNYDLHSLNKNGLVHSLNLYFPRKISESWFDYYQSLFSRRANHPEHKWDFWDYQWTFSIWLNKGLCVYPNVNLVSNIGFGPDATHTFDVNNKFSNLPVQELKSITSPRILKRNKKADLHTSRVVFSLNTDEPVLALIQKYYNGLTCKSRQMLLSSKKLIPQSAKILIKRSLGSGEVNPYLKPDPEQYELERIKSIPRYVPGVTNLLNRKLRFVDSASFLFMYDEIFKKKIYAFRSTNNQPFIIDCGANIGLSILYFKQLYPGAKMLAFEPDPKVFQVLQANVSELENVEIKEKALWNEETKLEFFSEGADGGSVNALPTKVETNEILTEKLSHYLDRKVDFLKIDIEGAEVKVLTECESKLHLVQNIFVEYHSFVKGTQDLATLLGILERNNFRYHINSPGLSSAQPFVGLNTYNGMDMQLNIYAFQE